jgi:hypothetical protein
VERSLWQAETLLRHNSKEGFEMTSIFAATVLGSNHFEQGILIMIIGGAIAIHFGKKFLHDNPEVKDVAKKAASSTAIGLISRFIRK